MQFKLYEEKQKEEKTVYFRLVSTDKNIITLEAVSKDGYLIRKILTLKKHEKLRRYCCIADEIDFVYDDSGRIAVND